MLLFILKQINGINVKNILKLILSLLEISSINDLPRCFSIKSL